MFKKLSIIAAIATMGLLTGCGNSAVNLVQEGTMGPYKDISIEDAFENAFDDASWDYEEKKRRTYVTFTGTIKDEMHDAFVNSDPVCKGILTGDFMALDPVYFFKGRNTPEEFLKEFTEEWTSLAGNSDKQKALTSDYLKKYVRECVWPVGSEVNFKWKVDKDGESFELKSFGNDSWQQLGNSVNQVMNMVYAD